MVIEDDENIRATFHMCLEHEGYAVESYSNGKDALARLEHCPDPCLILLDLMMPVMNGAEFMREFAKFPKAEIAPIPIYLCSATADAKEAKEMGCLGFVRKPLDLNILLMIVEKYCKTIEEAA